MSDLQRKVRGRGWAVSLQRLRGEPIAGVSPNLGAAPMVALPRRGRAWRFAVRAALGERLWVAVETTLDATVRARLSSRQRLVDNLLRNSETQTAIHRLARIDGSDQEGIDPTEATGLSLYVGHADLKIEFVAAHVFDAEYGGLPDALEPQVYSGWRLP